MEQENKKGLCGCCPFWTMWIRPRETIRKIVDEKPKSGFWWLSLLYGINFMFFLSQVFYLGRDLPLWGIIVGSLVLATPVGAILITLYSVLVLWLGKLIKGGGNYLQVRAAVTWSVVTNIVNVIVWIVYIIMYGSLVFLPSFHVMQFTGVAAIIITICGWATLVASIWSIVILVQALGEVQGFSAWMGLLNVVLASVAVTVIYYLIGLIIQYAVY